MRTTAYAAFLLLAVALSDFLDKGHTTNNETAAETAATFATRRYLSKGGLGIIRPHSYVAVKTDKNEILFGENDTWVGLDASKPEVVVFSDGKVWATQSLPKQFDLSSAVVISFERDKIRFFDFQKMEGGYYARLRD